MANSSALCLLLAALSLALVIGQDVPAMPSCPHCQDDCSGDRSVAYVVDTTGSMRNDIGQVCERTREMAAAARHHGLQDSIQRCLLVPFGDPVIGPPQFFNQLTELANAACDLRPTGGIDCPEKVLSGLLMGIESSCPKSTVYVFTDAVAKDLEMLGRVLEVVQRKQIKVVFVLSGTCDSMESPYYDTIAAISGGQLFRIGKDDVGDILKFSQLSINNEPQVSLLWEQTTPPFWSSDFVIEPAMTSVQLVVSCDNESPSVELYRPGSLAPIKAAELSTFVDWRSFSSSVLAVFDTTAMASFGAWQLHVASASTCRVSVTAHGVDEMTSSFAKVTEINEFGEEVAMAQPVEGSNYFEYIVVSTDNAHIVQYVELVGVDGNRFSSSSPTDGGISAGASGGVETVMGPATVPTDSYFIRYRGLQNVSDADGHVAGRPFKRYSATALTPSVKPPALGSSASITADHCQDLKLKCPGDGGHSSNSADSLLPVTWFRNAEALAPGSLPNTTVVRTADRSVLHVAQFTPRHAGLYACFIAKTTGLTLAAEYQVTADENTTRPCPGVPAATSQRPAAKVPSIWTAHQASVPCLMLQCLARGDHDVPSEVKWTNTQSGRFYTRMTAHRHYAVLHNGSLRICDPQRQHVGWYMCTTPHSARPSAVRVKLTDLEFQATECTQDRSEEDEEIMNVLQEERDQAKRDAAVAKKQSDDLQSTIVNLQRLLHNADAERLRSASSLLVCQRRLTRIRTTLGLGNRTSS